MNGHAGGEARRLWRPAGPHGPRELLGARRLAASRGVLARLGPAAALVVLLGLSSLVRTRWLDASYWIDEGLSVGIATHRLADIPGVLTMDGSPPLYYILLHGWMRLMGDGETSTHALSLLFALLTIPAALWAGWSVYGRRTGWVCAALASLNPFITFYAQETRMYSLVVLLSLLAAAAFLNAFALRRRRHLVSLAVLLAALLYTHNWAAFFVAGAAAAMIVAVARGSDRRSRLLDSALALGGAALLFAPWIPTLLFQAVHTGAPWARPPTYRAAQQIPRTLLGGDGPIVALALAGGTGLLALMRDKRHGQSQTLTLNLVLLGGTVLSAWAFSKISPAWAGRYFAIFVGPFLLLVAACLARAGGLGLAGLAVVSLYGAFPGNRDVDFKSNAKAVAAAVAPKLQRGDTVLSTHPEQVPLLEHYMPDGLRYATPLGIVSDPEVMDWRDALPRMRASTGTTALEPVLDTVPRGGRVLLVRPIVRKAGDWGAPWTSLVRLRSQQWGRALEHDDRFIRQGLPQPRARGRIGVVARLYVKTSEGRP